MFNIFKSFATIINGNDVPGPLERINYGLIV